jgi:hypothetical protein
MPQSAATFCFMWLAGIRDPIRTHVDCLARLVNDVARGQRTNAANTFSEDC